MSSMIKKRGNLGFKPKAPAARRPGSAAPQQASQPERDAQHASSVVPARSAPATSPPPSNVPRREQPPSSNAPSIHTEPGIRPLHVPEPHSRQEPQEQPSSNNIVSNSDTSTLPQSTSEVSPNQDALAVEDESLSHAHPLPTPPTTQTKSRSSRSRQPPIPATNEASSTPTSNRDSRPAATTAAPQNHVETPATAASVADESNTDVAARENAIAPVNVIINVGARTRAGRQGDVTTDLSRLAAGESAQQGQLVQTTPLNADGTSGTAPTPVIDKKRKSAKRKRVDENGSADVLPTVEVQLKAPRTARKEKVARKRKEIEDGTKKTRKRAETPEDAEEQEIDHSTTKMADLCKDIRIGRKFSRHEEIKRRELEKKIKAKLLKDNPELAAIEEGRIEPTAEEVAAVAETMAPTLQMRIVGGQIVQDDTSTQLDRHAQHVVDADMEVVEENDFTRTTNSGSYMKRTKSKHWSLDDYELLYTGIRMFGTDFGLIANLFGGRRDRRMIKLKFNKEERECPDKIDRALIGEKVEIDLEEYKGYTGVEYQPLEELEREQQLLAEEHDAEYNNALNAEKESERQKRDQIHGTSGDGNNDNADNGAEGEDGTRKASAASKSKKRGSRKKNLNSSAGGGEEVEVIGAA